MNVWQELGIAPTRDLRAIKRAYATRLRQVHPEEDAEGFQRLRAAYESARRGARRGSAGGEAPPPPTRAANDRVAAGAEPAAEAVAAEPLSPARAGAELAIRFVATADAANEIVEARLRQLLQSPLLRSLVAREQFEQQLLRELLSTAELPLGLTEICIRVLEWNDRRHPLWREGLPMLVTRFAAVKTGQRTRTTRGELAAIRAGTRGNRAHRNALLALLGPVQPLRYRWLALSAANREAIAYYLRELPRLGQDFFERETGAEAVAWWRRELSRPHLRAFHWLLLGAAAIAAALASVESLSIGRSALAAASSAHPLAALALAMASWAAVFLVAVIGLLELGIRWRVAHGPSFDRWIADLRHTRGGRLRLFAAYALFLAALLFAPGLALQVAATGAVIAVLAAAFGRLALRLSLTSLPWAAVSLLALGPRSVDGYAAFPAGLLVALPVHCGAALVLHERWVRRGWPVERIGLWMRGLVLLYWLLPLSLLTVMGVLTTATR